MLFAALPMMAQYSLSGVVTDKYGVPIKGAVVSGMGVYNAETGIDGSFMMESLVRVKKVKVTAPGMNYKIAKARNNMTVRLKQETFWNKKPEKSSFFVLAEVGIPAYNETAYGAMVGVVKKHGFYLKGMYSPAKETKLGQIETNYHRSDDPALSGKYQYSCSTLNAGYIYRLGTPLYIYIGGGIGKEKMAVEAASEDGWYEDTDGKRVDFERGTTPSIELGLMFKYDHLLINSGLGLTGEDLDKLIGHIGIGYIF